MDAWFDQSNWLGGNVAGLVICKANAGWAEEGNGRHHHMWLLVGIALMAVPVHQPSFERNHARKQKVDRCTPAAEVAHLGSQRT
jgi:hypothetical protein